MRPAALLLAAAACGGSGAGPAVSREDTTAAAQADSVRPQLVYPEPARGRLVARSGDHNALGGSWRARAGRCDHASAPADLLIAAAGDSLDVLLLLVLPDTGAPEGELPVMPRDSASAAAPHARIGVQRISYRVSEYEGAGGTVTLERVQRRVHGRFDLRLRDVGGRDTVRFLGVFADVPVETWSAELCGASGGPKPPTPATGHPTPR